jgi:hypothetical protein
MITELIVETCRIEHPDDAIVKITVWMFFGMVSAV